MRLLSATLLLLCLASAAQAQLLTHPNASLDYVYPAGGRQGQSVAVELGGIGGLDGATSVLIDGPPGITVSNVKAVNSTLVNATFSIAADAPPGRRWVRVLGGSCGLTSARYFFVGNLPEVLENEDNASPATAQEVALPVVVNGRIGKELDVDCFRFTAKAGQKCVLAVLAHGMDSVQRAAFIQGYVDTSLELLDEQGNILAAADDTIGLDPALVHTFKANGRCTVRIQSLSYKGSLSSVYRLTLGDVPYPICAFPPGGQRGSEVAIEVAGLNSDSVKPRSFKLPAAGSLPLAFCPLGDIPTSGFDLPLLRGEHPELREDEPNDSPQQALRLSLPCVVNGRIDRLGDEDWYRVALKKDQQALFEVTAQRHLRSPIDTVLEIYDAAGKKLAENDDGAFFAHQCAWDFASADSWLRFTAPADGDYVVRLRNQGDAAGRTAVYRLSVTDMQPVFELYQWPDAVPIWGPGTSATFIVELYHAGLTSDLDLRIEGLPAGWTGSSVKLSASTFDIYAVPNGTKALLTITAPPDAAPGTTASFRVLGTTQHQGRTIEREAQYLTLYGNSHNDRMFLRSSPGARAVVAGYMDAWPTTTVRELTVTHGDTVMIPVQIQRKPGGMRGPIGVVINAPTVAAACALGPPVALKADQDTVLLPLKIDTDMRVGTRGIVIARSWSSDIRSGRPGPCTPLILLHVRAKSKASAPLGLPLNKVHYAAIPHTSALPGLRSTIGKCACDAGRLAMN